MEAKLRRAREDGVNEMALAIRRALGEYGEGALLTAVVRGLVAAVNGEPLTVFFDSWGSLWRLADDRDTENVVGFGPNGAAVRISASEAGLNVRPGETAFSAAEREERLAWRDGWYWLTAAAE